MPLPTAAPTPAAPLRRPVRSAGAPAAPLLPLAGILGGLALLLPGCDNPACVFGGDCSQTGPGNGSLPGGESASLPADGQWIRDGAPTVTQVFPAGAEASAATPIALFFSESISPAGLAGGFELVQELPATPGGPGTAPPLPLTVGALVGDGRVAVLFPPALVPGATYQVRVRPSGTVTDLTGELLIAPLTGVLGTFSVAETTPPSPRLLAAWPPAGATSMSTIPELVAIFDRPMNPATVNGSSFQVLAGGEPPDFDPPPAVLSLAGPFGGQVPEPRVFTWRSVDGAGTPSSLGAALTVELLLSPSGGGVIQAADGMPLPATTVAFETAETPLPASAGILSGAPGVPDDAIGIAQLDGTAPLMILVELGAPAIAGDRLGIHVFGDHPETPSSQIALSRVIDLEPGELDVLLEESELDLVASTAPLAPRLADGTVAFAFRHVRGAVTTPVRLLDVDPAAPGTQHPLLDTEPPELLGLGLAGTTLDVRSDLRDLVVLGLASEELRSVAVEALLLSGTETNGVLPPVVAADDLGRFVAAPIRLGLIAPAEGTIPILVTLFDRALNPSPAIAATYTQVGAVGPGAPLPGPDVAVRVLDATTLAPIGGAQVFVHQDDLGVVTAITSALTDAEGAAQVGSAPVGATLLTVDAPGYDLFTFQGVTTERLDVPLQPMGLGTASVVLGVTSPVEELELLQLLAGDSRRPLALAPTVATTGCFFNPFVELTECGFVPFAVRPRLPGGLSVLAINPTTGNVSGFAQLFLKAFELALPLEPIEVGALQALHVGVPGLLDTLGGDPDQVAVDVTPHMLVAGPDVPGLDVTNLAGPPRISVQALAHGIPGPLLVGLGKAFEVTQESWAVRAAHAGVAGELGGLVLGGTIDGDLFLEGELEDLAGNRASARPRFSATSLVLDPPGVPTVLGATVEGGTGSLAFTVDAADGLLDADGQPGLHRVRLTDGAGRGWDLWTVDAPDAAGGTVAALFPDVAALGGTGLATSGAYTARASTYAWPGLDPGSAAGGFLWTDVLRERDLFATSAPLDFQAP